MRKGILFSLLCVVAVLAVACGGGNNAGEDNGGETNGGEDGEGNGEGNGEGEGNGGDAADAYAIYRTVGNTWTHKTTSEIAGVGTNVSTTAYEVLEVNDDGATVKMTSYDGDGNETFSQDTEIPFATADATDGEDVEAPETTDETITVEAGDFPCTKMVTEAGGSTITTWTSKEHPGLTVKSESTGSSESTTELVEYEIN